MNNTTNETIPFVDLVAQYKRHKSDLDRAIQATLETSAFIGGPALTRFEKSFAEFCGAKYAVGCGNGTDAIYLALRGMGVTCGDEVIVPVNTFIATAEAVTMAGARPVFVDVDEVHSHIDLDKIEAAITPRTKVIIPVHLYGQLVDMPRLMAIANKHGLQVVEDCAQAHGAILEGKKAGSWGKAGCFSFYPGKNLGAYGDGGGVVTDDAALADSVRRIANHGRADKFGHLVEGVNSRLDGLQAAILEAKLPHLETWSMDRRQAAKRYDALLAGVPGAIGPKVRVEGGHVFHLYVVRVPDRDGLRKLMDSRSIQSGIHYPIPLHLLGAYAHHNLPEGSFPVAELLAKEIVSLPMFPEITEAQQVRVVQAIKDHLGGAK
jgi:dTDP-4-amino-4,6-dideoxygalactose transaminase